MFSVKVKELSQIDSPFCYMESIYPFSLHVSLVGRNLALESQPKEDAKNFNQYDSSAKQLLSGCTIEEGLVQSELPFSHAMPSTTKVLMPPFSLYSQQVAQTSHGPFTNHASPISEKDEDWCMDPDRALSTKEMVLLL